MTPTALSAHAELVLERTARILVEELRDEARASFGAVPEPAASGTAHAATGTDGTVVPFRARRS